MNQNKNRSVIFQILETAMIVKDFVRSSCFDIAFEAQASHKLDVIGRSRQVFCIPNGIHIEDNEESN